MGGIEQALRGIADAELGAAAGLLDEVRRRMFGLTPPEIRLGRYRVLERVGAGGGGVVVRGEDPRLGRAVAIKLVHPHAGLDDDGARRLLREARVLARLSHPDIVTIYDVGRIDAVRDAGLARIVGAPVDGSVYLVMQWLEGGDLSRWLAAEPRPWHAIVDAFLAAGRGLAAAHAAGVLHRDFKPANVMLDADGRARVGDFGLGRHESPPTGEPDVTALDTLHDGLVGTPLYMAPEQHLGEPVDARSDQYAFCFALHEALFGARSFASLAALVQAKLAGPPSLPAGVVPPAIARTITRGLARDPSDRWPTMAALLAALERARRPRSRARMFALLAAPALLLAAAGLDTSGPALCEPDDPAWQIVWAKPRAELAEVFAARAEGFGRDSFAAVDERMSARGRDWSEVREQVCAARFGDGIACLERQRRRTAEIVDAWRGVEREGIADAALQLERLDDPRACLATSPTPQAVALADEVERIEALVAAGRISDAVELADRVEPTSPRTRVAVAAAFDRAGRYADAEHELVAAVHEAESQDDAATALHASTRLIAVVGSHLGRPDDAKRWARHAWATLARTDDDGTLAAEVHEALGMLAMATGRGERALEHFEEQLRLDTLLRGDDELRGAANLANSGGALAQLARYNEAIERFERAIEIQRVALGEGHPGLAMTRHNLAVALGSIGRIDRARDEATRALDAWTAAYGERHPDVALGLQTLGTISRAAGELERAIELDERARDLRVELLGPDHPDTLTSELNLAAAYEAAGRPHEALALLQRIVVAHEADPEPTPNESLAWVNLGGLQLRLDDFAAAVRSLSRARELVLVTHGRKHLAFGVLLLNLGVAQRDLGELEASTATLAEAEAVVLAAVGPAHARLSSVYLERGRTWVSRGDVEAARADYGRALDVVAAAEHATAERDAVLAAQAELDR